MRRTRLLKDKAGFALVLVSLLLCLLWPGLALAWDTVEYSDVYLGSKKVFVVTNTHLISASDRAIEIGERLNSLVNDPAANVNDLKVLTGVDGVPTIVLGDTAICHVTAADAAASGGNPQAVASAWTETLQAAIVEARHDKRMPSGKNRSTLSEHAVLLLFLEIALLLLVSLVFGEIFVRLGQPLIIGQIVGGLLLGPSFFGTLFPDFAYLIFPRDGSQFRLISVVSWIGVSFLLMLIGMEVDMNMLKRLGKPAFNMGLLGALIPIVIGGIISYLVPSSMVPNPEHRTAFAAYLGTLFAASSVLVVATILKEMKFLKRDIGQLVLSAALSHELICCLMLAIIAVLSGSGGQSGNLLFVSIAGATAFVLVMYFGRSFFFSVLRWVNDKVSTRYGLITAIIVLLLSCSAATEAAGIHIVLGAFAAGVILSQAPVINHKVVRPLESVTMGFFAPIFFASAGLSVNLTTLLSPNLALMTIMLTIAAVASKMIACYVAGKASNLSLWESLSVGIASNARGSLGLILAMLGTSLNIISADMFSIVVFVALLSTAIAPPLMKWSLAKIAVKEEEMVRIEQEERRERTMLTSIRRVLWPSSGKGRNKFIAHLLNSIGENNVIEATVLWVNSMHDPSEKPFLSVAHAINKKYVGLLERTVKAENPVLAITDEANLGYDLLLMSADNPAADANHVFGELVDTVILNTSTRVLVVYEPEENRDIKTVLVAVSGTELSVSAGEFGISLAKSLNAKIICLCLGDIEASPLYSEKTRSGEKIEQKISQEIEGSLTTLAKALDVDFRAVLTEAGSHPAEAIIMEAERHKADLIVLGAEQKLGKGLFLGHTINFVLRHAPCTIAVLKMRG